MLIDFNKLKDYNITPLGVIHVGMHKAEEYPIYKAAGVQRIIFIEANPALCQKSFAVGNVPFVWVFNGAVSDIEEEVEFTITNNGESSSILELADHSQIYPNIVEIDRIKMITTTLDHILDEEYGIIYNNGWNILNLDIQGAELKAMKGLSNWDHIEAVFTEVNYREMYKGCALISEIDEFLSNKGFRKVEEVDTGAGWGDALYIK